MDDCLFCKINQGDIPSKKVYDGEDVFAIEDINPQAPVHLLIIPKKHLSTLLDIEDSDFEMIGSLFGVANQLAAERGKFLNAPKLIWAAKITRPTGFLKTGNRC